MQTFGLRWKAAYGLAALAMAVLTGCQGLSTPGSAPTLQFAQSTITFGNVPVGKSKTFTQTITNTTPAADVGGKSGGPAPTAPANMNVTILQITSSMSTYAIEGITLPVTLAPGQSATFKVKFSPKSKGAQSGSLSVTTDMTAPMTLPLTGTGAAPGTLAANRASLSFGSVQTGVTDVIQETLTNSGGSPTVISSITASGTGFSVNGVSTPITLQPGQNVSFNARFTPTVTGNHTGTFTIRSDASNTTVTISAAGTGVADGAVTATPASLSFGAVQVGVTQTLTATLKNTGGSNVTISAATVSGGQFSISGLALPLSLSAGQTASFSVKFKPTAASSASGSVNVTSDGTNPTLTIPLSGSGVADGSLTSNPSSLNFGAVVVGNNQTITETLTNSGGSSLSISAVVATGAGFSISGITVPATVPAGQSVSFAVKFAPATTGNATGNVTITSDGSNPTLAIPLSGNGVADGSLTASPSSLSFGSVLTGDNKTITETLTNSGGSNLKITAASASGSGFSLSGLSLPVTLTAGQSVSFSVKFAPTAAGNASGNVVITSDGSNPTLNIPLSGTGSAAGALGANPTSLSFGNVQVGNSSSKSQTVTNTGSASVTLTGASSSSGAFSVSGLTLPTTLNGGQSVTFSVVFEPTASGNASGNLTLTSNATNPSLTVVLSGTGTTPGQLAVSPGSQSFGTVTVGASASKTGTLSASGSAVQVTAVNSDNPEFTVTGLSLPVSIPAGGSTNFTVKFAPAAAGAASGTLTFTSNASNSPGTQAMSGTGAAPSPHSVDLTWTSSASSGVAGYNVYRGTASGGPYTKITSALNLDNSFTDSNVTAGTTYFYVVTAVDGSGVESGYSNQAQAVVPTP